MIQVQYTLCTLMYRGDFTHDPGIVHFIYSHVHRLFPPFFTIKGAISGEGE